MERICGQRDDVFCFIGGTGPGTGALQGQINRLNLSEKVKLLGPVPGDILPIWMNACDLFVLPSLSESFGIVQIEALACGKPVVSARNRGSEEVIISDEHGLLAEPADPESLSKKILMALNREWDREAILEYVEQFTWEIIIKEIMNIYCLLTPQDEAV
jgi:teichuronic acid biosynthesis glycosyltransferase TuaC